ncbi:MAG: 5-formyltetrahydrofolate cyclo-ligase [Nitrososphaeraceae archaeon]
MTTFVKMDKEGIRKTILHKRDLLVKLEIRKKSVKIQQNVIRTPAFLDANIVGIYSHIGSEVETNLIMEDVLRSNKKLAYPRIVGDSINFFAIEKNDFGKMKFEKNRFNIVEPSYDGKNMIDFFDLLIVPGIVFDLRGYRIGYGHGYYDKYLSRKNYSKSMGLGYELQVIDFTIPIMPHDQKLDMIITENRIIYC